MRRFRWMLAGLGAGLVGCAPDAPTKISASSAGPAASAASAALPAFPGAEGFGAYTTHGRGGKVVKVTNLNDSGPGSLRYALESVKEPRIVVFEVGGVIELVKPLQVKNGNGNVYIAGQTAPGDGITLKNAPFEIKASDVVVRYLRIRPGDAPNPSSSYDGRDATRIANGTIRNIIVDHVSSSWAVDENMSIWPSSGQIENVTVQWSIISEALRNSLHSKGTHGMGILIGEGSRNVSFHHNLLAHNNQRNPRIKDDVLNADIVNNVIYDWGDIAAEVGDPGLPTTVNFVGNYWKRGPSSPVKRREVKVDTEMGAGSGIYYEGNIGPSRTSDSDPEYAISDRGSLFAVEARFPSAPIREHRASQAYHLVLAKAGASFPVKDAVDVRVVQQVRRGTGTNIDSPAQVGGYPAHESGTAPADTDGDGMPDAWEAARGLDAADPADGSADRDGDGYTNVEEYINSLVD